MYNHITHGDRLPSLLLPLQTKGNSIKDCTNVCPKMDRLNLSIFASKTLGYPEETVYNSFDITLQLTLGLKHISDTFNHHPAKISKIIRSNHVPAKAYLICI